MRKNGEWQNKTIKIKEKVKVKVKEKRNKKPFSKQSPVGHIYQEHQHVFLLSLPKVPQLQIKKKYD